MRTRILLFAVFFSILSYAEKTIRTVTYAFDDATVPTAGTLRYEIDNAADGDSIVIPATVGKLTLEQEILIKKNIGINANGLIIQVETPSGSNYRVFNIGEGTPLTVVIDKAILKGGNLTGNNTTDVKDLANCGGSILVNNYATLVLKNSSVVNGLGNYAGAIYGAENTVMHLTNCYFAGNEATTNNAGAVYNLGELNVNYCLFEGNKSALDGAALTSNKTFTTIRNSVFYGNESATSTSANNGGAYFNTGTATSTLATVENCTFYNNAALSKGAGAYTASGGAKAIFTNCTFHGNRNNSATGAGAIYLRNSTATLVNCTVTGNSTVESGAGGGINISTTAPKLYLVNSIVAYNYKGITPDDVYVGAGLANGTNNVVGATTGTALENSINFSYNPESYLFAEYTTDNGKKVPVLKDNGGISCLGEVIKTVALVDYAGEVMSVAMETAAPSVEGYNIPAKDQRGYLRNATYPCVGAFELNGITAVKDIKSDISLKIYPNPARDYISLSSAEQILKAEIITLSGQKLRIYSLPGQTISLSGINPGIYLMTIYTDHGNTTQRISVY